MSGRSMVSPFKQLILHVSLLNFLFLDFTSNMQSYKRAIGEVSNTVSCNVRLSSCMNLYLFSTPFFNVRGKLIACSTVFILWVHHVFHQVKLYFIVFFPPRFDSFFHDIGALHCEKLDSSTFGLFQSTCPRCQMFWGAL